MLVNPIENASPLVIQRFRNLLADSKNSLTHDYEDPSKVSRIGRAIKGEFLKEFCALFGKTANVTLGNNDYFRVDISPQTFDVPLSKWLSRIQILVPPEGQAVEPGAKNCSIHFGEVARLMTLVEEDIERIYG